MADLNITTRLRDQTGSGLSGFANNIKSLVTNPLAAATAAAAGFFTALGFGTSEAAKFDTAMREVNTLLGLSERQFEELSEQTQAFATRVGIDTVDAVDALYQAISAGIPQENVFDFLEVASQASIGGVLDLELAVDALTTVVNNYGDAGVDAEIASNVLFTAVRFGKTTFEELSGSLQNLLPTANALGIGFEDAAAAATTLTTRGVQTNEAMTQVRALIQALLAPTVRAKTAFEEWGVDVGNLREQIAERGLGDAVGDLINQMREAGATDSDIRRVIPSVEALNAAFILASDEGGAKFNEILAGMNDSFGTTQELAAQMEQTIDRDLKRTFSEFIEILQDFGEEVLPLASLGLGKLTNLLRALKDDPIFQDIVDGFRDISNALQKVFGDDLDEADRNTREWTRSLAEAAGAGIDNFGNVIDTETGDIIIRWEGFLENLQGSHSEFQRIVNELIAAYYANRQQTTQEAIDGLLAIVQQGNADLLAEQDQANQDQLELEDAKNRALYDSRRTLYVQLDGLDAAFAEGTIGTSQLVFEGASAIEAYYAIGGGSATGARTGSGPGGRQTDAEREAAQQRRSERRLELSRLEPGSLAYVDAQLRHAQEDVSLATTDAARNNAQARVNRLSRQYDRRALAGEGSPDGAGGGGGGGVPTDLQSATAEEQHQLYLSTLTGSARTAADLAYRELELAQLPEGSSGRVRLQTRVNRLRDQLNREREREATADGGGAGDGGRPCPPVRVENNFRGSLVTERKLRQTQDRNAGYRRLKESGELC